MRSPVQQLAELMNEFGLDEAELTIDDVRVRFSKLAAVLPSEAVWPDAGPMSAVTFESEYEEAEEEAGPIGTPVPSPMTGIYYASPNPESAPFVSVGDEVAEGQVLGLIEAMKVFNEITSPQAGKVLLIAAQPGHVVNEGDVLVYLATDGS